MEKGLIKSIGRVSDATLASYKTDLIIIDANNSWVTPGLVDIHSQLGIRATPYLQGASDDWCSNNGNIQPFLKVVDALNTHDGSYELAVASGVTTALVLPGSNNAISGQGLPIKLRKTAELTPTAMLLEYPDDTDDHSAPRWYHVMHAYGENSGRSHSQTRMDTASALRKAYTQASNLRREQDSYCLKAAQGLWDSLGAFPSDLEWEPLVDVLRGKAKAHVQADESVDLDDMVRLSNEFQFPISVVHGASDAYLVPDLLKRSYGQPPAIVLRGTSTRDRRETYRSSEFAPRILSVEGLQVAMKSDYTARHLLYEAQQAYFYGLPSNLALSSITTIPSTILGLDHRVGFIRPGNDADVIIWDSHPMALGATPKQIWIDGIAQLISPHILDKPASFQEAPEVPVFDEEAALAVEYEGLPPLLPQRAEHDIVLFTHVKSAYVLSDLGVQNALSHTGDDLGYVVVINGSVACAGPQDTCASVMSSDATTIDLKGGSISPGFMSYGSPLGLEQISAEESTNDGIIMDPLVRSLPSVHSEETIPHALDALQYATRDSLLAYRAGVVSAVTAPDHDLFLSGISVAFSLGDQNKPIIQDAAALHVSIRHLKGGLSVSAQIAALRGLLLHPPKGKWLQWSNRITSGGVPLVIEAHGADIISSLILLKNEVEEAKSSIMKMTITGATEAHILAPQIAYANIGIIVTPSRPSPSEWEDRKTLPGPPMSKQSMIAELIAFDVLVGVGVKHTSEARNTRFDLAWIAIEANDTISMEETFALASVNLYKLLGVRVPDTIDLVATEGGNLLSLSGKPVAVISQRGGHVNLL
ncbi:carbohydrate esterase family 9 protein [Athelia psychrophila]|uniref:Carbohydrate esterase family 9 protein n=1 Tax=Athelia psychrophila TaxID=1759441 RepID=A0A166XAM9_9AGAM|nr:carbohydrate esterase family 9 protein [Fibularhizoctonia sp. CBS 109695]